jgi:hypothetical protein
MKILLSFLLVLTLSAKADFFGDIGDWFEGAANDTNRYYHHTPQERRFA